MVNFIDSKLDLEGELENYLLQVLHYCFVHFPMMALALH